MVDLSKTSSEKEEMAQDLFSFQGGDALPKKTKTPSKKTGRKKRVSKKKLTSPQPIELQAADEDTSSIHPADEYGPKPPSEAEIEAFEKRLYGDKNRKKTAATSVGFNINSHIKGTLKDILGVDDDQVITVEMQSKVILEIFPFLNRHRSIRAPFAHGFRQELFDKAPEGISKRALGYCIERRINTVSYQSMLAHYVQRRHLDGSLAEKITEEEAMLGRFFMFGYEIFSDNLGICDHDIKRLVNWRRRRLNKEPARIPRRLVRHRKDIVAERLKKHQEDLLKAQEDLLERQRINDEYGGKEKRKRKMRQEKQKAQRKLEIYKENARLNQEQIKDALSKGLKPPKVYVKHIYAQIEMDVRFNKKPTPKPKLEPVRGQEVFETPLAKDV